MFRTGTCLSRRLFQTHATISFAMSVISNSVFRLFLSLRPDLRSWRFHWIWLKSYKSTPISGWCHCDFFGSFWASFFFTAPQRMRIGTLFTVHELQYIHALTLAVSAEDRVAWPVSVPIQVNVSCFWSVFHYRFGCYWGSQSAVNEFTWLTVCSVAS